MASSTPEGAAPRAGLYLRVSTDDQAHEGYGLADQERRGREVAEREGWDVTVYTDPARSGADRDRPALARLLADVDAGLLDVVWFDAQDRLARDVGHTADLVAAFIAADVAVWEGSQPIDLSDDGQAQVDLKALFAAWERRKIKGRTRKGIAQRARSGLPWGEPGYGYQRGDAGHWIVEPAEAAVVRRIYGERVDRGRAYSAIARLLNAEGVPTRRGTRWTPTVARTLCLSRHVLGEYQHGGEWHQGQHKPIIEPEVWEAAQRLAEQGSKYAPGGRSGRLPKAHLLVRGALRCGHCGSAMLPRAEGDRYVCRQHKADAATCPTPPFPRAAIEVPLLALFEQVGLDVTATLGHVAAGLNAGIGEAQAQADRASRDAAKLLDQAARVEADYLAGVLGADSYERLSARLADDRAAAEAQAEQFAAHAAEQAGALADLDAEGETLRRLAALRQAVAGRMTGAAGDIGAIRAALASLFEAVYVVQVGWADAEGAMVTPRMAEGALERYGLPDLGAAAARYMLVPSVRPEALVDADRGLDSPEPLWRVPLGFAPSQANKCSGSGVPE